eukprot:Seg183.5 transcript_id=Seg183.5/GoldUCD/mRNA.D3Y31 product="Melanocortin receptor 5" protein_id=Seg183.5/GoldUCD/D3Y31
MENNSSNTGDVPCFPMRHLSLLYVYSPGVILHILIVRALISKLKLRKPMDKFLLSLSVADLIHMISFIMTIPIVNSMKPNVVSVTCRNARKALEFFFCLMIACSSGSIIALSLERYIRCIHCFRLHSIMTKKRTIVSISLIWCAGLIWGLLNEILFAGGKLSKVTLDEAGLTTAIHANSILIFATSAVLIFVQLRLFVFIHKRSRILPAGQTRATYQGRSTFLRQVKINVAVFAVVVAYLACMLPASLLIFLKTKLSSSEYANVRKIVLLLTLLNPVSNPFIYCIGRREILHAILSDFRAVMRKLLIEIFS